MLNTLRIHDFFIDSNKSEWVISTGTVYLLVVYVEVCGRGLRGCQGENDEGSNWWNWSIIAYVNLLMKPRAVRQFWSESKGCIVGLFPGACIAPTDTDKLLFLVVDTGRNVARRARQLICWCQDLSVPCALWRRVSNIARQHGAVDADRIVMHSADYICAIIAVFDFFVSCRAFGVRDQQVSTRYWLKLLWPCASVR